MPSGPVYELREDLHQLQAYDVAARFHGQPKFGGTLPPPKPPRPSLGYQQPPLSGPGAPVSRAGSMRGGAGGRENVYGAPRMDQRPLPSIPNIPEATAAGAAVRPPTCPDQCSCHPAASGHPAAGASHRPAGVVRSPSRGGGDGRIPVVPCSVGGASQPPSQHYTVLDPTEVQQLLERGGGGGGAVCAGASSSVFQPPSETNGSTPYGASFQYLSSDDGASCGSPSNGHDASAPTAGGSSCNEIPLRPARESSQPRIDAASSGSSGNSSWP